MERTPIKRRHYIYVLTENGIAEYVRYASLKGISATVPATIHGIPVTAVGTRAFAWKFNLHNVCISNGVKIDRKQRFFLLCASGKGFHTG